MTTRIRRPLPVALLLLSAAAVPAPGAPKPTGGVRLPPYRALTLQNGMTVLLMEQHKVPLVSLNYVVRAGSVADPAGKEGLASVTAALLRKGTASRTADQISEALDFVGASYSASAGPDFSSGRAEFVKKDVAGGLDLFADLLLHPVFPEAEAKKLVAQRIDAIKAAKDSAQGVIRMYFDAYLYGSHPYARPTGGDERSLAGISRDDVVKFHAANYVPANVILSVVGDFDTADMAKAVTERFGPWAGKGNPAPVSLAAPRAAPGKRLLLVEKPDSTQTYFVIGNVGVARNNPDRVPIELVNTLFGGRFTSMINTALRIKGGLTYGASSGFEMRRAAGPFFIRSYTKNASTEKALDTALEVLRQLHEKGITEEDLASAKAYTKGTLPPQTLETSEQLAALLSELRLYGLPDAEINDFYARVDAVTLADATRVIATYYPEKDLTFVLVGKAGEIAPVARKYATEVKTRPIAEPGF
jgi:predicted Zn-dependent peptidase